MKRLKYFFAAVLLLLALPFWRFIDFVAIFSPFAFPLTIALTLWFSVFIALPVKLIFDKVKTALLISGILCFAVLAHWSSPLSKMASADPEFNHCGGLTYTGLFYPLRSLLSEAHHDDLDARNQLCWVRKMITKVPEKFDSRDEITTYNKLIQDKLLKPRMKYRAALPLIAVLYVQINTSGGNYIGVKEIFDSLHFWIDHYNDEISERNYSPWSWPHSDYIRWEYGLIEKNWHWFIENLTVTTN